MGFVVPLLATAGGALSAAVAAGTAILTYTAQQRSVRQAQQAMDVNALAASRSAADQYRGLIVRQIREESAAAVEIDRVEREALKATSSAALAATESGAGGGALADQVRNFRASALSYQTAVKRNLAFARSDTALTLQSVSRQARSRVSTFRPEYERPSLLGAGLTVAGGFLDAARFAAPNRSVSGGGSPSGYYRGMPVYG